MADKIKVVRLGSALVCGTWADCFFEHESNVFGTRIDTDGHGFFLNTNFSNRTNVFGTQMNTDFF